MFNSREFRRLEARLRLMLHELRGELASRNWNEPLRPWSQFFERFDAPPRDVKSTHNRIVLNSYIYQTNYCVVLGVVLPIYLLYYPSSILAIGFIIGGFMYVNSPTPIVISGRRITRSDRYRGFFILSLITLSLFGVLSSFFRTLFISVAAVIAHAYFRHTNLRQKASQFRNQQSSNGGW